MARNIVNPEELKEYVENFIEDLDPNPLNSEQEAKCQVWLNSVARNWILANGPTKQFKISKKAAKPEWMNAAIARGEQLQVLIFTTALDDQLSRLVRYVAICDTADVRRLSWDQAVIQQAEWVIKERNRREEERKIAAANNGVLPICTFSDGLKVVEIKTADALIDESVRQHNCLNGYTRRLLDGEFRAFSIRDQNDKSIISVGVDTDDNSLDDVKETCNRQVNKSRIKHVKLLLQHLNIDGYGVFSWKQKPKTKAKKLTEDNGIYDTLDMSNRPVDTVVAKQVNLNLIINNTNISQLPVDLVLNGGLYARNTPLESIPAGEYKGNVDISNTKITCLPENSVFHGHVYASGLQLTIPRSTVIKGKVYS